MTDDDVKDFYIKDLRERVRRLEEHRVEVIIEKVGNMETRIANLDEQTKKRFDRLDEKLGTNNRAIVTVGASFLVAALTFIFSH